jgi:transketolase
LVREAAETYGCVYIRFPRKPVPVLYTEKEQFKFGKAKVLKSGKDVCFMALGSLMVNECLKARDILSAGGIDAGVTDILTLKPIDRETVLSEAAKARCVVSAENHQINGGLGSAVAEILAESSYGGRFGRIGIMDEFGEVGTQDYLTKRYGLDAETIAARARILLS